MCTWDFLHDRAATNGLPIHCTSGADDKEKCCLESRSWLNLGHPDGAYTFSTILLFLLSALPRSYPPGEPCIFSFLCSLSSSRLFLPLFVVSQSLPFYQVLFSSSFLFFFLSIFFLERSKARVPEGDCDCVRDNVSKRI